MEQHSHPPRYSILSSVGGKAVVMSSTLVETVSINYEDFNESFLTCSTCLCTYDGGEHIPKLLFCSHTVCLHCLTKIVQSAHNRHDSRSSERALPESFRCPICRETIKVPRGGVAALPPSFLVNQLLDLMARQRRDVVPKCGVHPSQELLFCESCDTVFCSTCTSNHCSSGNIPGSDQDTTSLQNAVTDHTVVPFSIAIKRMSEILLYKANEISAKLVNAEDNVTSELNRLEQSKAEAIRDVEDAYTTLEKSLKRAKEDALQAVLDLANRKSQMLMEQLDVIRNEKNLVQRDVNSMQYQIEVRSLTDRIASLQEKLESVSTLAEPRENSFLVYEAESSGNHRSQMEKQFEHIVTGLGRPRSSTALPSLCRLFLSGTEGSSPFKISDRPMWATHQGICGIIETYDYHGCPKQEGGDPIKVTIESDNEAPIHCSLIDAGDGSYRFWFRPTRAQLYRINASLFGRPLKNSPLTVEVVNHKKPYASAGSKGSGNGEFLQPSGVVVSAWDEENDRVIYILDSGNQRIAKYSQDLHLLGYISSPAVEGRSATGLCLSRSGSSLWVANWKARSVAEVSLDDGRVIRTVSIPSLKEPVDVAVNSQGHLMIADAGQSTVYVTTADSGLLFKCGSVGQGEGQFSENNLRAIACASDDDVVAADSSRIQIFSSKGKYLRTLPSTLSKGYFGGMTYDGFGHLLVSYIENAKNKGPRCGVLVIRYCTGETLFNFDSTEAHLKRPGRLSCTWLNQEALRPVKTDSDDKLLEPYQAGYVYVTDDDFVKKYRYL